jgi:Chalcone isomerase-like
MRSGDSEESMKGARMRRVPLFVLCGLITISGVGIAHSKECAGVSAPDQVLVEGSTLVLNGLGLRQATVFKVNVYVGALYTAKATSDPSAILGSKTPNQLVLHFVRNVGAADLRKAWEEGFEANAKSQLPALQKRIDTLKSWMADMKTGERLTLTQKPGRGIHVDVGEAAKGTIEGDDFSRAFLSIWLGAHPPNADLKAGLLGGACS